MSSRLVVMIELPERSCPPQVLEQVLGQVREFFDRYSSGLRESTGQRLRVTIGPWEAHRRRWAGEYSGERSQSSQDDASTPTNSSLEDVSRHAALGASSVQDGGVHELVQQQSLDGQTFAGEGCDLEQRLAQGMDLEDLNVPFPGHDFGIPFNASSSQFAGQSPLYRNSLEGIDINGQPLPILRQLLPPNAASPSNTRENDVSPQPGEETLIHRAANNLAARPVSEYTTSQVNPYPRLQWAIPRSPAYYLAPGPGRSSTSHSPSRKQD